jgi:hypothetical protein
MPIDRENLPCWRCTRPGSDDYRRWLGSCSEDDYRAFFFQVIAIRYRNNLANGDHFCSSALPCLFAVLQHIAKKPECLPNLRIPPPGNRPNRRRTCYSWLWRSRHQSRLRAAILQRGNVCRRHLFAPDRRALFPLPGTTQRYRLGIVFSSFNF